MGQEQSYAGHPNAARYKDSCGHLQYRGCVDYGADYKRHKARRSADSFKSDHSTESSGYRSGSSSYDHSDRSTKSEYYCTPLYKNTHYKDINKDLYKPVKIKEKRYSLLDLEKDQLKSARLKSYIDSDTATKTPPMPKKSGIRNYTPKILSEGEQRKKAESRT